MEMTSRAPLFAEGDNVGLTEVGVERRDGRVRVGAGEAITPDCSEDARFEVFPAAAASAMSETRLLYQASCLGSRSDGR